MSHIVRRRRVALAAAVVAAATTTASGLPAQAQSRPALHDGAKQVQAPVPSLTWGGCPSGWGKASAADPKRGVAFTCSTAKVPLDYDAPHGATIDLALRRVAATDQRHKLGTLFVNPGGPGGSGVDFMDQAWQLFSPQVRAKFDIVSFDPRGIARSTPLVCWSSDRERQRGTAGANPYFPDTRRQFQASSRANDALTSACRRHAGPILDHMATADVARDMDLLRQAVGDQKLTYDGISYGTYLGQTYAAMFPGRIRSMVLDAVVDPVAYPTGTSKEQAAREGTFTRVGSDAATWDTTKQFFHLCNAAGPSKCTLAALGDSRKTFAETAARLRRHPITVRGGGQAFTIDYQLLVAVTGGAMYRPSLWQNYAKVLTAAAVLTRALPAPRSMSPSQAAGELRTGTARLLAQQPVQQTTEGLLGVVCTDANNPRSYGDYYATGKRRDASAAPYFGSEWSWISSACATWPGKDDDRYTGPWTTRTSAPVLVVGTVHDSATPYAGAVAAHHNLAGSRLLTYSGWGHPAVDKSRCVAGRISTYILSGELPAPGTVCTPTGSPFDAPSNATGSAPLLTSPLLVPHGG